MGTTHFHVYFRIKYIDSSVVSLCACERFSKAKSKKQAEDGVGEEDFPFTQRKLFSPKSFNIILQLQINNGADY